MLSNLKSIYLKKTAIAAIAALGVIGVSYGAPPHVTALYAVNYNPVAAPFLSVNAVLKNGVISTNGGKKERVFFKGFWRSERT